jgi:hypothetical protein
VVDHEDPTCSGVGHVIGAFHGVAEKVHVTPLILVKVRFFLPELQNEPKRLPQVLKLFILPPGPVINGFEGGFVFFFFIYFD